jgi:hypothetical protein
VGPALDRVGVGGVAEPGVLRVAEQRVVVERDLRVERLDLRSGVTMSGLTSTSIASSLTKTS